MVNITVPEETTIYEPIAGYCGFENEDGEIAIAPGDAALSLARRYEPFAVYRAVPEEGLG